MSRETVSEKLFAAYCQANGLAAERIAAGTSRSTDFRLFIGGVDVFVEIKQIESTRGINPMGVFSRTIGDHVRRMISGARKQMQAAAGKGAPTILLIYNKADEHFQSFGTEPHDFVTAMYGELTVRFVDGHASDSYHGQNALLRRKNTSFSAIGHLRRSAAGAKVKIYENVYARNPLPFDMLPTCIEVVRVEVSDGAT